MYYVIMMTDAMSNPNTKTDVISILIVESRCIWILSYKFINLHESNGCRRKTRSWKHLLDQIFSFYIKYKVNFQVEYFRHTVEDSWSSSDEYHLGLNLGFDAVAGLKFGMHFNYTHTFTASYSEKRDITDWSVVEQTDAVSGDAKWSYYQQWPVDMLRNSVSNFPSNWQQFYSEPWHPCKVKSPSNLSKYAFGNHNSVGRNLHNVSLGYFT